MPLLCLGVTVTDAEVFEMMNEADTNQDGQIDFKEVRSSASFIRSPSSVAHSLLLLLLLLPPPPSPPL